MQDNGGTIPLTSTLNMSMFEQWSWSSSRRSPSHATGRTTYPTKNSDSFKSSSWNAQPGGDPIPGAGSLRKLRFGDEQRAKGKRGGVRIIYFYHVEASTIWLITLYGKNERDDLDAKTKRILVNMCHDIKRAHIRKRGKYEEQA
jgi:hypothetical protein